MKTPQVLLTRQWKLLTSLRREGFRYSENGLESD